MKSVLLIFVYSLTLLCSSVCFSDTPPSVSTPNWEIHFSPNGGCTESVVKFIDSAKNEVLFQAYSFTSPDIELALVAQGAKVIVVLDKSNAHNPFAMELVRSKAEVMIDTHHAIAHNKVVIVDGVAVETGSFNFTRAAEKSNAENCLILRDPAIALEYRKQFMLHRAHSTTLSRLQAQR